MFASIFRFGITRVTEVQVVKVPFVWSNCEQDLLSFGKNNLKGELSCT